MMTFILTAALIATCMGAMALGVVLGGRRLRGSCGGGGDDCLCERRGLQKPADCSGQPPPERRSGAAGLNVHQR